MFMTGTSSSTGWFFGWSKRAKKGRSPFGLRPWVRFPQRGNLWGRLVKGNQEGAAATVVYPYTILFIAPALSEDAG